MLTSILKLAFLSQLIILSLEEEVEFPDCKILANEVKNETRTVIKTGGGIYTVGFYANVSSWTDGKDLHFYVEMSDEDILDVTTEQEVFNTYAYFTDTLPTSVLHKCIIDKNTIVEYKSSVVGSKDIYEKFRYKVSKTNKKYLLVAVDTTAQGGFENDVYFYLGDDGLSKKTIIIIIIVIVVILVIAGIVVLVLFIRKKNKKKQKTQKQQGQTQVLYNEYGQQYVNNVQVNNQGISPTDNRGNVQYGQYGQTAPYSAQGFVSG